jgi:2-dehydro-3-deoxyphosphogluconate aldolase/(4S)-4-hydroxy-2-oxoglutarate aldolase
MDIDAVMGLAPVLPVIVVERAEDAVPLGRALVDGGLKALEITLRTPCALEAIRRIAGEVEGAVVGAGTVLSRADLEAAAKAGARFAVSPGLDDELLQPGPVPMLPGVATATEVMRARRAGLTRLKFFPAMAVGGVAALKGFAGPFPDVRFCPTGGVDAANAPTLLALKNVACVGGSWVAPAEAVKAGQWDRIRALAQAAAGLSRACAAPAP